MSSEYNIYFSTHSGTSERFATQISQSLLSIGVKHKCKNISELEPIIFKEENNFIFIISTHFDGDSCKDGEKFYSWIQDQEGKSFCKGKKFTLFGLGDNTFTHFNRCSKTYYQCFQKYEMEDFYNYEIGSDHD